ncbi:hypothetical protein KAJ61_04340 [Candidatus Parcubacteria bacterium]|nr:hypothetical protein [Candidatus Parcubacteria bacterium]
MDKTLDKTLKKFLYFLGYSIFLFALVLLIIFYWSSRKNISDVEKTKQIAGKGYYQVEPNGISFKDGMLTINTVDKKGQQQTINLRSVPRQNIIEVRKEFVFIVSTYFIDECISNHFICRDGKSWEKFMNFIHENTHLIGLGSTHGSKLYIF